MDKAHLNDFVRVLILISFSRFFFIYPCLKFCLLQTQVTKKRFIVKLAIKRMDFKVKKNRKKLEELAGKV